MRLLIGAGTPKEAVARGWYFFVLLRTTDGATYAAILEVFVENSAGPALIVFTTGCDHCLDGTATSSTGCHTVGRCDRPRSAPPRGRGPWPRALRRAARSCAPRLPAPPPPRPAA